MENGIKAVWYILVQLSSLMMIMVSGFSVQVSGKYRGQSTENRWQKTRGRRFSVI
jgi:hypothetical protein